MAKLSIYDLAFEYARLFMDPAFVNKDAKIAIMNEVQSSLNFGVNADALLSAMYTSYNQGLHVTIYQISKLVYGKSLDQDLKNLLIGTQFHLHPELRITSPPPITHVDLEAGKIVRHSEEYFLEMRASYTLEDLCNYYMTKKALLPPNPDRKRIKGGLRHLLDKYSIETVLFMIDAAEYDISSFDKKPLIVSVAIGDYFGSAMEMRDRCLTQAKEAGDKVVQKRRMLPNRSGARMVGGQGY